MNFIKSLVNQFKNMVSLKGNINKELVKPSHFHPPKIIQRAQHNISRKNISRNALKVLYRLNQAGFDSYLVGGCVRDLLLGRHPKDFDVATNATPEEVYRLFRNCRLIGRRFRLAHVHFGREIIEVATFRRGHQMAHHEHAKTSERGIILRDNVYGTLEEDAWRRDFSINALYYSIRDFSLLDFTGGLEDLKKKQIRILGDPNRRYMEDPIRLIRAIRFAGKLGFSIESSSCHAIEKYKSLLREVPPARLFEEMRKLFHSGTSFQSFELLKKFGLLPTLFPLVHQELGKNEIAVSFVKAALQGTDERVLQRKPIQPAFFFAAILWPVVRVVRKCKREAGCPPLAAMQQAADEVIKQQIRHIAIPRRLTLIMKEIWIMQHRFHQRLSPKAFALLEHPRLNAAYDFLLLRTKAGENTQKLAAWWGNFIGADNSTRESMVSELQTLLGERRSQA